MGGGTAKPPPLSWNQAVPGLFHVLWTTGAPPACPRGHACLHLHVRSAENLSGLVQRWQGKLENERLVGVVMQFWILGADDEVQSSGRADPGPVSDPVNP